MQLAGLGTIKLRHQMSLWLGDDTTPTCSTTRKSLPTSGGGWHPLREQAPLHSDQPIVTEPDLEFAFARETVEPRRLSTERRMSPAGANRSPSPRLSEIDTRRNRMAPIVNPRPSPFQQWSDTGPLRVAPCSLPSDVESISRGADPSRRSRRTRIWAPCIPGCRDAPDWDARRLSTGAISRGPGWFRERSSDRLVS